MTRENAFLDVIETYFEHLDAGRAKRAAAQFTTDAVFESHPPGGVVFRYAPEWDDIVTVENGMIRVEGRDSLGQYFEKIRGSADIDHEILRSVLDGDKGAVVGTMSGPDVETGARSKFISYARLRDGQIANYQTAIMSGIVEREPTDR